MLIDFLGIQISELKALISWYMQRGCTITTHPLHTDPVRLVIATESGASLTIKEIYERAAIEKWFEESGQRIDPMSRSKVISLESCLDQNPQSDETDELKKLTWFIQNHLHSLQQYITADNLKQVKHWLRAWSEALKDISYAPSCGSIRLQYGISLPVAVYIAKAHQVQNFLQQKYNITYEPSIYRKFCAFLDEVAPLQNATAVDCWNIYLKYLPLQPKPEFANCILSKELLQEDSEDLCDANQSELKLTAMQLACYRENIPAVRALIYGGATYLNRTIYEAAELLDAASEANEVSIFDGMAEHAEDDPYNEVYEIYYDGEDEDEDDKYINIAPDGIPRPAFIMQIKDRKTTPHALALIELAIILDNRELFTLLKDVELPGGIAKILKFYKLPIAFDKPEYIEALRDEYEIELDVDHMMREAIRYSSERVFAWLMREYKDYIESISIGSYPSSGWFRAFANKGSTVLKPKGENILQELLKLYPNSEQYIATSNPTLATQLLDSDNIATLIQRLENRESFEQMNEHQAERACTHIYRTLFAEAKLLAQIRKAHNIPKLETMLAQADYQKGELSSQNIVKILQQLAQPELATGSSAMLSDFARQTTTRKRNSAVEIAAPEATAKAAKLSG